MSPLEYNIQVPVHAKNSFHCRSKHFYNPDKKIIIKAKNHSSSIFLISNTRAVIGFFTKKVKKNKKNKI